MVMTTTRNTENRLSSDDYRAISCRIVETLTPWRLTRVARADELEVLTRAARWAIGCTAYDLRDNELDMIDAMVAHLSAPPTCPVCCQPADAPHRRYRAGAVIEGCVSRFHDGHLSQPVDRAWHDRPEARRVRAGLEGTIGTGTSALPRADFGYGVGA